MSPSTITVDPNPPQKGKNCTIGYTGPLPVTLRYAINSGGWVEVTLTTSAPSVTVAMPSDGTTLEIEDVTGNAPFRDLPIS